MNVGIRSSQVVLNLVRYLTAVTKLFSEGLKVFSKQLSMQIVKYEN